MTKDGFIFLVMGFTGKKAAQFKEAYINAFNQMEKELNNNLGLMHSHEYRHESHLAVNAFYEACEDELKKAGIKTPDLPRPDNKVLDGLISGMLMTSRFLLSFDHNLKVQISQVPMNACIIDTKNKSNMSTIIREFVPIELIPELMQIGIQRLSKRIN